MTVTDTPTAATTDAAAISDLTELFALQKAAFLRDSNPSLERRREHLGVLAGMVLRYRERIQQALSADYRVHPTLFSDLVETLGVAGRAAYAAEQLEGWLEPQERFADPALFGNARAAIRPQPKGVIGNIVPWNFPFDISLGPLVEMLAAGNRVVIKPSEYTPACAELLAEMIAETFDRDHVGVAVGGLALAKTFPTLPWDHLLYTGNGVVARDIARAAAENLVPLTLELGGKSPAILHDDSVDAASVDQILGVKLIKNGQMCISVDYCLVPRDRVGEFVELVKAHMAEHLPNYAQSEHCTGIINDRHLDRLASLLDEARAGGAEVITLDADPTVDRATRRMPLSLVIDPDDGLGVMREEVFGPILPIKPYDSLDEAIGYVNTHDRPLGLYVFAKDWDVAERVLSETVSGGACVNAAAVQGALPALGFGGSGASGYGRHHGIEGFREFSNPRGLFSRGEGDLINALAPPYDALSQAVVDAAFSGAGAEEQK